MKVDILGTEYKILELEDEKFEKNDADAFCEWWKKEIHLKKGIEVESDTSMLNLASYKDNVIRHEIVHAFLFESGMCNYERDENIVEWIARNVDKISAAFMQAKGEQDATE